MTRFLIALAVLIGLLAFILLVAPALLPAKAYKARLEAAASRAIGRETTIGGDISFRLAPAISFTAKDLAIANAEGFEGDHLVRIAKADLGVKLRPLLSGKVEITRFSLDAPDFNLRKSADGRVNWNLAAPAPSGDTGASPINDVSLGVVAITDGRAIYEDGAAKQTYRVEGLNATARLNSLREPFELDGEMIFQGAPAQLSLVVNTLAGLAAKEGGNVKINAAIADAKLAADMTLASGDALAWSGPVKIEAPDLPGFASLFGVALRESPGFDSISLTGEATGASKSLSMSPVSILFDKIDASGDLALDWSGPKMRATGALATPVLDLRTYLPPPTQSAGGFPAWSTDKFDFSGLNTLDADLDVRADKVFMNELEAGATRARIEIAGGKLTAEIPQVAFYGGDGQGRIVVDATRAAPAISGQLTMSSVAAQPFTIDLMRTDRLLGLGAFTLNFSGAGASQAALMKSLDGRGSFDLADGAIKGFNIAKLASAIGKLYEGGITNPSAVTQALAAARRPDEQTDFSKLLSEFSIDNGVVTSSTITLEGPYLTMTGAGVVDLANQTIDLRLLPRASTAADNASGRMVSVPLRVGGTFAKPTTGVDVESLVKGKAEETLRNFFDGAIKGRRRTGTPADGEAAAPSPQRQILDSVLAPAGDSAAAQASGDPVGGALKSLFRRKREEAPAQQPAEEDAAVEN